MGHWTACINRYEQAEAKAKTHQESGPAIVAAAIVVFPAAGTDRSAAAIPGSVGTGAPPGRFWLSNGILAGISQPRGKDFRAERTIWLAFFGPRASRQPEATSIPFCVGTPQRMRHLAGEPDGRQANCWSHAICTCYQRRVDESECPACQCRPKREGHVLSADSFGQRAEEGKEFGRNGLRCSAESRLNVCEQSSRRLLAREAGAVAHWIWGV